MNKRIVILGAGESGVGAAILAKTQGYQTFVSDMSKIKDKYKDELDRYNIEWEEFTHTLDKILKADEIIKSPGIPNTAPAVQEAISKGIPVLSEIEFAGRYSSAKMICITGSNGKTTTTSLLYHIFRTAGQKVGLAGNIGKSLARQVALNCDFDYYIIELSSFQLDNMYKFKADIAILLNITPDHLDRYDYKMENYIDAKFRIIQNQTYQDHFIYWADDPIIKAELKRREIKAKHNPFSLQSKTYTTVQNQVISVDSGALIIDQANVTLAGTHNLYNTMAAVTAAHLCGLSTESIIEGLRSFTGVEHRLEYVDTKDGVTYINDSKATNVDSCFYALGAMKTPTILILGGKDKGNDYDEIKDLVKEKCKALIFMGVDNSKLESYFGQFDIPIKNTNSMNMAVAEAKAIATAGDTVLLSPCCASFDLFTSYENRGDLFKQAIKDL